MKTIQVVLEEPLLDQANRAARKHRVNRSELIRNALRDYLRRCRTRDLEELDRRGYERKPIQAGEFDVWDRVAAWPED